MHNHENLLILLMMKLIFKSMYKHSTTKRLEKKLIVEKKLLKSRNFYSYQESFLLVMKSTSWKKNDATVQITSLFWHYIYVTNSKNKKMSKDTWRQLIHRNHHHYVFFEKLSSLTKTWPFSKKLRILIPSLFPREITN